MPISSKKVMEHLSFRNGRYTRRDVINHFMDARSRREEARKGKKRRRSSSSSPRKDIDVINKTIDACLSAGFLQKEKNALRTTSFHVTGPFSTGKGGDGVVTDPDGLQVVIPRKARGSAGNNDIVHVTVFDYRRGDFLGTVDEIIARDETPVITRITGVDEQAAYLEPLEKGADTPFAAPLEGQTIHVGNMAVVVPEKGSFKKHPRCRIVTTFSPDDESHDFERICVKHDLPSPPPEPEDLPSIEDLLEDTSRQRKDFRDELTITIDGETAKDFDDALSLKKEKGVRTLSVHIADVSSFIPIGSRADREALERGNSYYIGNQVIPMFHEVLSNDLCSLRQGEDRLTMSVEIDYDSKGKELGARFYRGVIRVDHRLTYRGAEKILKDSGKSPLKKLLGELDELTDTLKEKRLASGRIDLNLTDVELKYKEDRVTDLDHALRLRSHGIIEECMLSANTVVARALKEAGIPSLYRNHEPMEGSALSEMKQVLRLFRIPVGKTESPSIFIQNVLKTIRGKDEEEVVNYIVLRSMMQAFYGVEPLGHFGLGFTDYTHFTSPIRRYPDLVVHRCLKSLIDGTDHPFKTAELVEIGEKTSDRERQAMRAERDMIKLKSCRLMKDRVGEVFDAMVTGVSRSGFFVTLRETPVEGMVPLRNLEDDYYHVLEDSYTVVGRRHGKRFRIGDRLEVRLAEVDLVLMRMDFDLP